MKNVMRTLRMSVIPLVGASLIACAPFFDNDIWQPSPGMHAVRAELRPSIGYYDSAVTAINARHYAFALEYLQAARAQKPDDVRVLTAFGVVYDKLGRFDLSARYYAQAAAVDPQSKIIAADLDYSRRLQGFAMADSAPRTALVVLNPVERTLGLTGAGFAQIPVTGMPAAPTDTVEKHAPILRTAALVEVKFLSKARTGAPAEIKTIFLTGHPLTITDASGRNDTGKSVKSYLSGLGWTLAKGEDPKLPVRAQTVIVYPETMITAAKALARTLSLPMRLTASNDVQGLQLILGGDISSAHLAGRAPRPQRLPLMLAAANREKQE